MVASIFVIQGFDTFRHPEKVAPRAEPVVRPLADRFTVVPAKTEDAVRLNGAVQMAAGTLLALGRFPRLSALALAATLVPTTAAGHRFWEAEEDADRTQQRIHFLKNLSMFGGLLITAADTSGQPSLAWRTRHGARAAGREAGRTAQAARRETGRTVQAARRETGRTVQAARREAQHAGREARRTVRTARREARLVTRTAKAAGKAGRRAGQLTG
jgi:putative oxidoreductase